MNRERRKEMVKEQCDKRREDEDEVERDVQEEKQTD